MVFTKTLKILSVLIVIFAVLVILAEKYLPEQEELRRVEDLPEELRDWFKRGKYYNVFGHRVFAIWNGDSKGKNSPLIRLKDVNQIRFLHGEVYIMILKCVWALL